jgi:hypothetical protein
MYLHSDEWSDHVRLALDEVCCTCQCVKTIDMHGTGATNPLATAPPHGKGRVYFVLNLNQSVQVHGCDVVCGDPIALHVWGGAGSVAMHMELSHRRLVDVGVSLELVNFVSTEDTRSHGRNLVDN